MRKYTKILALTVVLATAGWFAGCNGTIDREPNVVLEVATLTIPAITAATTSGVCTFTITNTSVTFNNRAKNHLAGEAPFNDIRLQDVTVDSTWPNAATTQRGFPVGGTVPAGGTLTVPFAVVDSVADIIDGATAGLQLTFRGTTVSGEAVTATTGGTLLVNSCPPAAVGACCTLGVCAMKTSLDCGNGGGTYTSDNTPCPANNTCP
jgi:hypothetical protein